MEASYENIIIVLSDSSGNNSENLTINHNHFSELTMNRVVSDAANSFSLSIYDDDSFSLEKKLIMGYNYITISYMDKDNKVYKNFSGNITKMSSSFINGHNMLSLEGYVGISMSDKYELKTRNWNKVVLFPWQDIFDDWPSKTTTEGDKRIIFEKIGDFFCESTSDIEGLQSKVNSLITDNLIYVNSSGQYYTFSQKHDDCYNDDGTAVSDKKQVLGTTLNLPTRPSDIVKLICKGGNLSELMTYPFSYDSLKERYVDCENFITTLESRESTACYDIGFMYEFLKSHEDIQGNGWTFDDDSITEAALVDYDFQQTNMSDINYIYNVLIPQSTTYTEENSVRKYVYNYTFTVNEDRKATFKPIVISSSQKANKSYGYYGKFEPDSDGSTLVSFSATYDILSAYLTGDTTANDDLNSLNLITGKSSEIAVANGSSAYSDEGTYKYSYTTKVSKPIIISSSSAGTKTAWQSYWLSLMSQVYKAKATIIGDSKLSPGDYIEVLVIPRPGLYHYTSGLYYIIKQEDVISNGKIISNLELIKNVSSLGTSISKEVNMSKTYAERYAKSSDNSGFSSGSGGGGSFGSGSGNGGGSGGGGGIR